MMLFSRPPRSWRITVVLFLMVGGCLFASAASAQGPYADERLAYKAGLPGVQTVQIIDDVELVDRKRGKPVPLRVYTPVSEGPFPVIVFSHDAGGSKAQYLNLAEFWSSHGYVCIHPNHADALEGDQAADIREVARKVRGDRVSWINRAADVKFIIDSLDDLPEKSPALKGKIDRKRVAAAGHGMGAHTAEVVGGARLNVPAGGNLGDPRVDAVLLLSPPGAEWMGLGRGSWQHMRLPMMAMTGSRDEGVGGRPPAWRTQPFQLAPPPDKYLVFIEGARGDSFTGDVAEDGFFGAGLGLGADDRDIFEWVQIASVAFLDAHLKGSADAKQYLHADDLPRFSFNKLKLKRK